MKRFLKPVCYFALSALLFTACSQETTPYDRYLAAQKKLFQCASVTINWAENDFVTNMNFSDTQKDQVTKASEAGTLEFSRGENGPIFAGNSVMDTEEVATGSKTHGQSEEYFRNGVFYHKDDGSSPYYALAVDTDYAEKFFTNHIFDYPKSAVASQSSQITEDGEVITVVFDSEKLYAHLYPEVYRDLGYGSDITYEEPFTFVVYLDKEGRLNRLHGTVYMVSQTDNGYHNKRDFTFTYSRYNETTPDLSGLNPDEYTLIPQQ